MSYCDLKFVLISSDHPVYLIKSLLHIPYLILLGGCWDWTRNFFYTITIVRSLPVQCSSNPQQLVFSFFLLSFSPVVYTVSFYSSVQYLPLSFILTSFSLVTSRCRLHAFDGHYKIKGGLKFNLLFWYFPLSCIGCHFWNGFFLFTLIYLTEKQIVVINCVFFFA